MTMEAGTGVTQSQAQGCPGPPEAGRGRRERGLPTPALRLPASRAGGDECLSSPWLCHSSHRNQAQCGRGSGDLNTAGQGSGVGKGGLLSRSVGRVGRRLDCPPRPLCAPAVQVQPRRAGDFIPQRDGGRPPQVRWASPRTAPSSSLLLVHSLQGALAPVPAPMPSHTPCASILGASGAPEEARGLP